MKITDEMIFCYCAQMGYKLEAIGETAFAYQRPDGSRALLAKAAANPQNLVFWRDHQATRPAIVCLCGSTRFWRTFQQAGLSETLAGKIVLSIGAASGTDDDHFGNMDRAEYERVKAELDELHLRKIDLADEVLVLNVDGYIGESTRRELEYARSLKKPVRFWQEEHVPLFESWPYENLRYILKLLYRGPYTVRWHRNQHSLAIIDDIRQILGD